MSVVFGRRTMTEDADVEALFRTIDLFMSNQVPGKWIVDGYPQLAKLPRWLQWWRPYGEQCFKETVGYFPLSPALTTEHIANSTSNFRNLLNKVFKRIALQPPSLQWQMITALTLINKCLLQDP
jgi:hypothetical protein